MPTPIFLPNVPHSLADEANHYVQLVVETLYVAGLPAPASPAAVAEGLLAHARMHAAAIRAEKTQLGASYVPPFDPSQVLVMADGPVSGAAFIGAMKAALDAHYLAGASSDQELLMKAARSLWDVSAAIMEPA